MGTLSSSSNSDADASASQGSSAERGDARSAWVPEHLEAVPGSSRDIYEVANQLGGYVDPSTPVRLGKFLIREADEAAKLADEVVRLRKLLADPVELKPLAWQYGCAQSPLGQYVIQQHGSAIYATLESVWIGFPHSKSVAEAELVAQKDYEHRIRSAVRGRPSSEEPSFREAAGGDRLEKTARAINPSFWETMDAVVGLFEEGRGADIHQELREQMCRDGVRTAAQARSWMLEDCGSLGEGLRETLSAADRVLVSLNG